MSNISQATDLVPDTTPAGSVQDIEVDRKALDASIAEFVDRNPEFYARTFYTIHDTTSGIPRVFNLAAALLGPLWAAARGV